MSDVLSRIVADKRAEVSRRRRERPVGAIEAAAKAAPLPRGFRQALERGAAAAGFALICEIKKASPSKGLIRKEFDPAALARGYAAGGASCLSVLTDAPYFQGCDGDLIAARAAVDLPVLRKDFMLEPWQIFESRSLAADCVLLILAALGDSQAQELESTALDLGMDVLLEVHDQGEMERALRLSSRLVGINNRDLKTLEVDLAITERLAPLLDSSRLLVAESGLATARDLHRLQRAGAKAFLIGESLMRQGDVTEATRALFAGAEAL